MSEKELDRTFRLEHERSIGNDGVVRYRGRFYQLQGGYAAGQAKALVCEGRFGAITIEYRGGELRFGEIAAPVRPGVPGVKRSEEQRRALREAGLLPAAALTWPSASPETLRPSGFAGLRCGPGQRETNTTPNLTTNSKRGHF